MGLMPSEGFDPEYYGDRYPDIVQGLNRLAHYLTSGRAEGRRPVSKAKTLSFDHSRIDSKRETVLLIIHEASRTGAPILAYNVAMRLRHKYNVVAVLLAGGELVEDFHACCAAVVGPLAHADWDPCETKYFVKRLMAAYRVSYAIVNSIVSGFVVPPLASAFVPVVLLMHEFASYTQPKSTMRQALDRATEIVFSANIVAQSAQEEHPRLTASSGSYRAARAVRSADTVGHERWARPGIFVKCFGRQGWKMRWSCWVAGMFTSVRAWIYSCRAPLQWWRYGPSALFVSCGLATDTLLNTT